MNIDEPIPYTLVDDPPTPTETCDQTCTVDCGHCKGGAR